MKSRSGGGKGSRSNSVENEEASQQRPINPAQLLAGSNGVVACADNQPADGCGVATRNESTVPSSPPPSYEHVLEEARMEQSNDAQEEEEAADEVAGRNRRSGGGGPGGGERAPPAKGPEILHKSSKEFYRAVAKQWGITCKMSDHCRCLDCQSHYFDCEYDKDEQEKTDGGLGAGTPMFISEVIHGTACVLL